MLKSTILQKGRCLRKDWNYYTDRMSTVKMLLTISEVRGWKNQEKTAGGYVLRTGESQRKDGRYSYTALDKNRRTVYAKTLVELRAKERKSSVTKKMD
ncbi:integrase DNA-binding domain-containing protein [Coprococcus comes]|uniref:integrase DNA-binding domain-containing protein n=2 Tax=Lachnospiraceae TaxID=186803 RepID=UPI002FE5E43A